MQVKSLINGNAGNQMIPFKSMLSIFIVVYKFIALTLMITPCSHLSIIYL